MKPALQPRSLFLVLDLLLALGPVLRAEPLPAMCGLVLLVQRHPECGHPLIVAR